MAKQKQEVYQKITLSGCFADAKYTLIYKSYPQYNKLTSDYNGYFPVFCIGEAVVVDLGLGDGDTSKTEPIYVRF